MYEHLDQVYISVIEEKETKYRDHYTQRGAVAKKYALER